MSQAGRVGQNPTSEIWGRVEKLSPNKEWLGLTRTTITEYTVMYGAYIRFWPTLVMAQPNLTQLQCVQGTAHLAAQLIQLQCVQGTGYSPLCCTHPACKRQKGSSPEPVTRVGQNRMYTLHMTVNLIKITIYIRSYTAYIYGFGRP